MKLSEYARRCEPGTLVRMFFESPSGRGTLLLPVEDAIRPNQSHRYFPPGNATAADMGWPVPYWYGEEVTGWEPV